MLVAGCVSVSSAVAEVVFTRDVQPLLAELCVKCHGPEKQKGGLRLDVKTHAMRGGDDGKVIEPGHSGESRLIHFVEGRDAEKIMPPKGERLSAAQIATLRQWIDTGAEWPEDGKDVRIRSKHWSLQTLRLPEVPKVPGATSEVDAFIIAKLSGKGLVLSPQADRPTLIRRVTFDLTGLPPTPADIDAFIADDSPRAYEKLVERLLASPHYGERWGRHWLDVARYTESNGFEHDRPRDNAWHYRDYVIASFNGDKPYDRFMREQIAGDVLEPVTRDGIIAPSLLVCGPWDFASSIQKNPTQRAFAREDELEDLVGVVAQTFLGFTVNCARCHSHKFDPVPHEDYYRFKSVFEGVKHGERELTGPAGKSYTGTREQPQPTHLLARGDVKSPKQTVTPGGLSAVADIDADFGLSADAPEAQRRLKFADWLADARNPLPARVMANRVWHFHFGQGLVSTPNDFGVGGAQPSHPELIDWLASKFIASGWSVKALHRLIIHSAAYRQSSAFDEHAASVDADNVLLWRFTPRRLEGEAVRDAMLAASGQLNPAMGGPSFRPFTITDFNASFYHLMDRAEPEFNRRTVYRMNVNSGRDPLLDAFDCPDPSVKTPRRGVTTTPLQALELMNNSFVQRQAAKLAERSMKDGVGDFPRAIQTAYRLALGRVPAGEESSRALTAARERGMESVCWALLNSTEFIYVR
jgi:hypothetical protein